VLLIVDVSQRKTSSLVICSGIGDEGSGALAHAFIQKLSIPDLNIIYSYP
jgi:predicted Fe-Mo cluster-binding NifX family protein